MEDRKFRRSLLSTRDVKDVSVLGLNENGYSKEVDPLKSRISMSDLYGKGKPNYIYDGEFFGLEELRGIPLPGSFAYSGYSISNKNSYLNPKDSKFFEFSTSSDYNTGQSHFINHDLLNDKIKCLVISIDETIYHCQYTHNRETNGNFAHASIEYSNEVWTNPLFYGSHKIQLIEFLEEKDCYTIKLEDLIHDSINPCVISIKVDDSDFLIDSDMLGNKIFYLKNGAKIEVYNFNRDTFIDGKKISNHTIFNLDKNIVISANNDSNTGGGVGGK